MNHCINIKIDYLDDDLFEVALWRFRLGLLECLKSQTDPDFDIVIRCQERHIPILEDLGIKSGTNIKPYIFTGNPLIVYDGSPRIKQHPSEYIWEETQYLKKYHIQTMLDYDDYVSPFFVAKIHDEMKGRKTKHCVNFMPIKMDIVYLEVYKMLYYVSGKGSMFLSVFCPDLDDYFFIFSYRHLGIPKKIGSVTVVPEGYCWYIIYNGNTGNARKKASTLQFPLAERIINFKG